MFALSHMALITITCACVGTMLYIATLNAKDTRPLLPPGDAVKATK